jgi:hypothetical protein
VTLLLGREHVVTLLRVMVGPMVEATPSDRRGAAWRAGVHRPAVPEAR